MQPHIHTPFVPYISAFVMEVHHLHSLNTPACMTKAKTKRGGRGGGQLGTLMITIMSTARLQNHLGWTDTARCSSNVQNTKSWYLIAHKCIFRKHHHLEKTVGLASGRVETIYFTEEEKNHAIAGFSAVTSATDEQTVKSPTVSWLTQGFTFSASHTQHTTQRRFRLTF